MYINLKTMEKFPPSDIFPSRRKDFYLQKHAIDGSFGIYQTHRQIKEETEKENESSG